jgi:hypothetical protein
MNRVTSDDVRAAAWCDRHAPAQSRLVGVTPSFPRRLTAGYARAHDAEYPGAISLTEEGEGFRHRMLGPADIPRLETVLRDYGPQRTFVILTPSQQRFGRLYGVLPDGAVRSIDRALASSDAFRLVYRGGRASIYKYLPGSGRAPAS